MRRDQHLKFNQDAPDLTLLNTASDPVRLSSLWADKPLLLAFTRHFGCTQCKEMLSELVTSKPKLDNAGLDIAVIMHASPQEAAQFAETFAPGLLSLADPDRKAYQAYGVERGNIWQTVLNWKVFLAVKEAKKKGFMLEPPPAGQDAMQMSAIFIINTRGKIVLPFYYDNIADHPSLDVLLSGVLTTAWDKPFEGPIGPGVKSSHLELEK